MRQRNQQGHPFSYKKARKSCLGNFLCEKDDLADSQGEEGGVEWMEGFDTEEPARSSFKERNQQGCPFSQ